MFKTISREQQEVIADAPVLYKTIVGSLASDPREATTPESPPIHFEARNIRIVVVDDDDFVRSALCAFLGDLGFNVVGSAIDGFEGVTRVTALRPDVVLMDMRMPVLDGIEATARISIEVPGVRVVIMSAYDDSSLRDAARAAGAHAYILKGSASAFIESVVTNAAATAWDRSYNATGSVAS